MDLVSVIIPVYNGEKYIEKCYSCLRNQKYSNYEIIFVNDGSVDNTLSILTELSNKYSNLVVVNQNNQGVSSARNTGLKISKGKYITFVDVDDEVDDEYLLNLVNTLENNNAMLSVCSYLEVGYTKSNKRICDEKVINVVDNNSEFLKTIANNPFLYSPWGKLYVADIIKKNNIIFIEGMTFAEDRCFVFDYLKLCKTVSFTSKMSYIYNQKTNSSAVHRFHPDNYKYLYAFFEKYEVFFNTIAEKNEEANSAINLQALLNLKDGCDYYLRFNRKDVNEIILKLFGFYREYVLKLNYIEIKNDELKNFYNKYKDSIASGDASAFIINYKKNNRSKWFIEKIKLKLRKLMFN